MTMRNLVDEVRRRGGELSTEVAARAAVETVVEAIDSVTKRGEKIVVRGFGTFERKQRAERTARNPKTGEPIKVAAREQLTFKDRTGA
jgi:DNA-binding protein HU-beta